MATSLRELTGMKQLFSLIAAVLLTPLFAADSALPAHAIIYGVEIPPFIMATPYGATGIVTDVVQTAFRRMQEPGEVQVVPWARAFEMVKARQARGIIPTIKTPERAEIMLFPDNPVIIFTMAFFKRRDAAISWHGKLSELKGYRFIKLRAAMFAPEFDAAVRDKTLQVEETDSFASAIRMVAAGRADLAAVPLLTGRQIIATENLAGKVEAMEPAVYEQKIYLALARTPENAALIARLDKQLALMWQDGTIKALTEEYRSRGWLPKANAP